MTKQDFVDQLNEFRGHDNEALHQDADTVLLAALRAAGWAEVADAWEEAKRRVGGFWYS